MEVYSIDNIPQNVLNKYKLKESPKVKEQYSNTCLQATNFVFTVLFLLGHIIIMLFFFSYYGGWDWMVIVYSLVQLTIGIYSLLLIVGEPAFQIVLLKIKLYINWLLFVVFSITLFMLLLSVYMYFMNPHFQATGSEFILYQVLLNVPTLIFVIPFIMYEDDLD